MQGYLLLDMTGSMAQGKEATIDACNEYIKNLQDAPEDGFVFTLGVFNSGRGLTVLQGPAPIADIKKVDHSDYAPDHQTPLYDAIGDVIEGIETSDDKVLLIIVTDGEENDSKRRNREQILELITGKTAKGWKFAYLGCEIDAMKGAVSIGVPAASSMSYARSPETGALPTADISNVTSSYRASGGAADVDFDAQDPDAATVSEDSEANN